MHMAKITHEKIEWIVVDDGTDCVRDIMESKTKSQLGNIRLKYIYEKENGFGKKAKLYA